MLRPLLNFVVILHYCIQKSEALSTSLGTKFYFLAPNQQSDEKELFVFLFTLSTRHVQVVLTTPWFEKTQLNEQRVLERLQIYSISIPTTYMSKVQQGIQFSYKIEGTGNFGVIVFFVVAAASADSFSLLPVTGWGKKYMAITKSYQPSVQVVTDVENNVNIHIMFGTRSFQYQDREYTTGDVLNTYLREGEAFTLSFCDDNEVSHRLADLGGSRIECSAPCGLISGNCLSVVSGSMPVIDCDRYTFIPEATRTGDVLAEMIMPLETFGKEFISIHILSRDYPEGVDVYSSEPDTVVTYTNIDWEQVETRIPESWTRITTYRYHAFYFFSNKPVYAIYYMEISCQASGRQGTSEEGDIVMCNIIPINLFYDGYVWSTPFSDRVAPVNYVCLIVKTVDIEHLRIDDLEIPTTWNLVFGAYYRQGTMQVAPGTHNVYGVRTIYFGCYIYGLAKFYSYINPAGFIAATINSQCTPAYNQNISGDLIDNDCDQRIDEEIKDGIDNDNDNRIDEDLANPPRANGAWSEWQEWTCILECHVFRDTRLRLCDNPAPTNNGRDCEGNTVEYRDSDCGRNVNCPTDCPVGRWDLNCTKSCEHCEGDCNTFLGNCTSCAPGFMFPERSCNEVCPPFKYGKNCEGNCMEKCEAECLDKVNGNCPLKDNPYLKLLWMLLLIPVIALFLFVLRRRQNSSSAPVGEAKPLAEPPAEVLHSRAPSSVPGSVAGGKAKSLVGDLETSV